MSAAVPASVAAVGTVGVVVTTACDTPDWPGALVGDAAAGFSAYGHLADAGQSHWVVACWTRDGQRSGQSHWVVACWTGDGQRSGQSHWVVELYWSEYWEIPPIGYCDECALEKPRPRTRGMRGHRRRKGNPPRRP